ncbi:MAG: Crp/Fnr family transcriptional regulator [Ideonella sp.]|nr:Crp/Fnr family transcriptional regulator [Ideonella sp.]
MEHRYAATAGTVLPERILPGQALESATSGRRNFAVQLSPDTALWRALLGGSSISAPECELLASVAQSRLVGAGQPVFNHTDLASALIAVREGEVALGLCTEDGTFRTERIVHGPAWLDLSAAWIDECHPMDARAMTPVSVVELPKSALSQALQRQPGLAQRLIQSLARQVQEMAANTHELMHKDAPARLAQWLSQRCEPVAGSADQAVVHLRERKRDVASQLAITPETLSRLMRSFTRLGVIEVAGYTVHVLDTQALGQLAKA